MEEPQGKPLMAQMKKSLPLYCYVTRECRQTLLSQGLSISLKARMEIRGLHYLADAGGIMCAVELPGSEDVIIISVTQLNFADAGLIYEKINAYKKARIEWLKEEQERDRRMGVGERVKCLTIEKKRR